MAMTISLSFYKLPPEILNMIVEELLSDAPEIDDYGDAAVEDYKKSVFPNLTALRLSSHRFSYLPCLMDALFRIFTFRVSEEQLTSLRNQRVDRIVSYVKVARFVPPPNGWTLTLYGFRIVVLGLIRATRNRYPQHPPKPADSERNIDDEVYPAEGGEDMLGLQTSTWEDHASIASGHWFSNVRAIVLEALTLLDQKEIPASDPDVMFSESARMWTQSLHYHNHLQLLPTGKARPLDEALSSAFERYHEAAIIDQALLQSAELVETWAATLQYLKNARIIVFGGDQMHWLFGKERWRLPEELESLNQSLLEPIGDVLFAAVVGSLAKARVKVRGLHLHGPMSDRFEWQSLPLWETLELGEMRVLRFGPGVSCDPYPDVRPSMVTSYSSMGPNAEESIAGRAAEAISLLMEKSSNSLEDYLYACPLRWYGPIIGKLPRLRSIKLLDCIVEAHLLKDWMAALPSLEVLGLEDTFCDRHYTKIFQAIRDHPKRIKVAFRNIVGVFEDLDEELCLEYNTAEFEKVLQAPAPEDDRELADGREEVIRDLKLYLSRKGEWTEELATCINF